MCGVISLVDTAGSTSESLEFADFYNTEFAGIALIAGTTCSNMALGEDIAQEALTRAAGNWDEIRTYDRPGAWLRRVAINLALNKRERAHTEARALRLIRDTRASAHDMPTSNPEVWTAVEGLPPRQRAVVVLHYLEGRPVSEIADILDIAVTTATTHLHRARSALATALDTPKEAL